MKKVLSVFILLVFQYHVFGQTFTATPNGAIIDNTTQCFDITVSGVGNISSNYGLASVCLNINHTYVGDAIISLVSPDGTQIFLSNGNGSSGDNYTGTCFTETATNSITTGIAPFTGNFLSEEDMGTFNNGQNADGIWQLCIEDEFSGDEGTLLDFSLTFSNNPAPPPPTIPSCLGNAPAGDLCSDATPVCNFFGYCGNTSAAYSPDDWPELDAADCIGSIDNDSYITFVASSTTASFNVWVYNSQFDDGIQMDVFDGNCGSGPVTLYGCDNQMLPTGTTGTPNIFTATGLTPGNTYYLMFDGFAGDVCDYTLAPLSGVSILSVAAITPGGSTTICPGGTGVDLQVSGGTGTYTWSPATGLSTTTGAIVNANPTVTTNYTVSASGGSDCPTSTQVTITVVPFNPFVTDTTLSICSGRPVNITNIFPIPAGSTTTYTIGGVPVANPNAVTTGGIYQILSINSSGCRDSVRININSVTAPALGADQTGRFCTGGSFNLFSLPYDTTGLVVKWLLNNSVVTRPDSITVTGTYTLAVSNVSGCVDTALAVISYFTKPNLGNDTTISVCPGTIVDLNSLYTLTGLTANWTIGGSLVTTPTAVTAAGTYQIIATNSDGCKDTARVTLNFNGALNLGNDTAVNICPYNTLSLPSLYPASAPYTNTWYSGATIITNPGSVSTGGMYTLISSNGGGCKDTATVSLTISTQPNLGVDVSPNICPGTTYDLNAAFTTTGLTNVWTISAAPVPTPATVSATGTYQLIATNTDGCRDTALVNLGQFTKPNLGADATVNVCPGTIVNLTNVFSLTGLTPAWTLAGSAVANPSAVSIAGNYQLIVINADGCKDTAFVNLAFNGALNLGNDTLVKICPFGTVDLPSLYPAAAGYTNIWYQGAAVISNPNVITATGIYMLASTNGGGCVDTAYVTIQLNPTPSLGADVNPSICVGSGFDLTTQFVVTNFTTVWTISGTTVAVPTNVTALGNYQLIASNVDGCKDTAFVNLTAYPKPDLGNDTTVSICQYQTRSLTNLYNTAGLTINWTFGGLPVANPASVGTAGIYQLIVTNSNGCKDTARVTLSYLPKPALGADKVVNICAAALPYDISNEFITTGLTAQWTFAGTPINPVAVPDSGNYQLIAINTDGCSDTASVRVSFYNKPNLGADVNAFICPGFTVNLTSQFVTIGLTSNWTLLGNPVANPASVTVPGVYQLIATNSNGCKDTAIVTVSFSAQPVLGNDTTVSICQYASSTNLMLVYDTSNLVTNWTLNNNPVSNPSNVFNAGVYQLIVANSSGCKDTARVTVAYLPKPNLGADKTVNVCAAALPTDISNQFTVTGLTSNWTDFNTGLAINPSNIGSIGVYQLIVVNADGCADTANVTVALSPKPALGNDTQVSVCPGGSFNLNGQFNLTGLTPAWTFAGSSVANPLAVTAIGTYQLIATNTSGCADTVNTTLSNFTKPAIGIDLSTTVCLGVPVNLTTQYVTTGLTSSWTQNATTVANPAAVLLANVYQLVATDNNGCKDTALFTIQHFPKPALGSDQTVSICQFGSTDLTTVFTTNGTTTAWTFGGTPVANPSSVTAPGAYQLIVTNSDGCTDTAIAQVNFYVKPELGAPKNVSVCLGSGTDLTRQFVTTGLITKWTKAGAPVLNPSFVTIPGVYELEVTNANGCKDTGIVQLTNYPKPNLGADKNTLFCQFDTTDISNQFATTGLTSAWSYNGIAVANPAQITFSGAYQLIVTDANSCKDTGLVNVGYYPKPDLGPDQTIRICIDSAANLNSNINYSGVVWSEWTNNNVVVTQPTLVYNAGNYQLNVRNNDGCRDTIKVTVINQPAVQANAGRDTVSVFGVPLQLQATGGVSYQWSPASVLNNPFSASPLATLYNDSTRFIVLVKDIAGCAGRDTMWVKTYQGPTYYLPNAFTPNGDGRNDLFRPKSVGISRTEWFRIFNRYGEVVFETTINDAGWDGTLKGVKQPIGNYIWMIRGIGYNGRTVELKGNVLLLQ